jgi:hypothetical protein
LRDRDWEDCGPNPGQIVFKIASPKITGAKWTEGVAQTVECLLCKCEALSSKKKEGDHEVWVHMERRAGLTVFQKRRETGKRKKQQE